MLSYLLVLGDDEGAQGALDVVRFPVQPAVTVSPPIEIVRGKNDIGSANDQLRIRLRLGRSQKGLGVAFAFERDHDVLPGQVSRPLVQKLYD